MGRFSANQLLVCWNWKVNRLGALNDAEVRIRKKMFLKHSSEILSAYKNKRTKVGYFDMS